MTQEEINLEEIKKQIAEAREKRRIGPPTESRYWSKKLEFFWKWSAAKEIHENNLAAAKKAGYELHAYHIGTRDFEYQWKIETGEIKLYA